MTITINGYSFTIQNAVASGNLIGYEVHIECAEGGSVDARAVSATEGIGLFNMRFHEDMGIYRIHKFVSGLQAITKDYLPKIIRDYNLLTTTQ